MKKSSFKLFYLDGLDEIFTKNYIKYYIDIWYYHIIRDKNM